MNQVPEAVWQYIAITAVGLVVAIIGWYARNTHQDLKDLRAKHDEFKDRVLTNFHDKTAIKEALDEIKQSVNAVRIMVQEIMRKGG
jgi:hypothetical protein